MLQPLQRLVPLFVVVVSAAACAAPLASPTPSPSISPTATPTLVPTPTPSPSSSPSPTLSPTPTATADTTAPAELAGRWRAIISTGEEVFLTLRDHTYVVERGGLTGQGRIDVTGNEVHFSNGDPCPDPGTYKWTVENDSLAFGSKGDACPGRRDVLLGQAWERVGL